ncbi:bifunctional Cyclophilin-type peptidyl-prolyl cis-trans isomerase [Babesia duncani]|uniref:Bifunctional Cyclophilin-type peptidyl-prolyl cis-trans isomerase n=1 Tax=Babesia duncani TaxID=323732 RepID=A0AAD9PIJ4_9APIC|nr:bifunctional Cyclophilin-type peptidyl-prolyl cis-trans isomerase [Babesia duncani]
MGVNKNRHSKDKLYLVPSELARTQGPRKSNRPDALLPLDSCALTLRPFTEPVCTLQGHVFNKPDVAKYILTNGKNPVTFEPLGIHELIPLNFTRDSNGNFQCPLSLKTLTPSSHVVAVRQTGNVYKASALKLVAKRQSDGYMKDPLSNEPFEKSDIITLQDPLDQCRRMISTFKHVSDTFSVASKPIESQIQKNPTCSIILEKLQQASGTRDAHEKIFKESKVAKGSETKNVPKHDLYTTSGQSASFTCTAMDPAYGLEYRSKTLFEARECLYREVKISKAKGYVKIITNHGDLNIMLHTDRVPLTCDNFLQHCQDGYYNDTIFHRCVPNFMIQGGDPTGTGMGGTSAFYNRAQALGIDNVPKHIRDEFDNTLFHLGPGVVSMANKGKNTNGSQFFITFATCGHLDRIHTVFGKVVGGKELLQTWSTMAVDDHERPIDPPKILKVVICSNPFQDVAVEKSSVKKRKITVNQRWLLNDNF